MLEIMIFIILILWSEKLMIEMMLGVIDKKFGIRD